MEENNEIIELSKTTEDTLYDEEVVTTEKEEEIKIEKKPKKKKKSKKSLTKKQKIIIICIVSFVILVAAGLLLYFLVFKDNKKEEPKENVVIQKDNYIYENGSLSLLDKSGKTVGKYECSAKEAEKCYVAKFTLEDNLDTDKYLDNENNPIEENSGIYFNNYIFIYDDEKIVLYDIANKKTTGEYELIKKGIKENLFAFKDLDGKYGIIKITENSAEELLSDLEYAAVYNTEDKFISKEKEKAIIIDQTGKALSSRLSGEIRKFNDKYISVYDEGLYKLYDYDATEVLDEYEMDFIDFYDNYIITVRDGRIYAFDDDLNKLNETGIKLKNDYYNKTYIFNKDGDLKSTKLAYKIELINGNLDFTLSDETVKSINIYEGLLNSKFDFVSYYDGVLYFYSDEEKTQQIGKYTCNNKNSVTSSTKEFESCFIAKETNVINDVESLGYAPIINGNYVFIKDTKTGSNKTLIYLYDISTSSNSSLPKYSKVDTGISSENITSITSLNGLIATQSYSDGAYGIITFGQSEASTLIPFRITDDKDKTYNTNKLSIFNEEYILAQRENKNYLYDKKGTLIASSIFEIVELYDKYMLVKDKGYILYKLSNDGENSSLVSAELDHINLDDNYFVGIKDNKLNIYKLSDGKTKVLEKDVELITKDSNYENYKVSYNDGYVIEVLKDDKTYQTYNFDLLGKEVINEEE